MSQQDQPRQARERERGREREREREREGERERVFDGARHALRLRASQLKARKPGQAARDTRFCERARRIWVGTCIAVDRTRAQVCCGDGHRWPHAGHCSRRSFCAKEEIARREAQPRWRPLAVGALRGNQLAGGWPAGGCPKSLRFKQPGTLNSASALSCSGRARLICRSAIDRFLEDQMGAKTCWLPLGPARQTARDTQLRECAQLLWVGRPNLQEPGARIHRHSRGRTRVCLL
jgi:hypothetical protein